MTTITQEQGMNAYAENPIIQSYLAKHGLGEQDVDYLLNPNVYHQHDPFLLKGVGRWIDVLHSVKGQHIAIDPDYDADGVLSGTLARVGLSLFGFGDVYLYPPKTRDGYGLTRKSVDNILAARPDTTVLITTDNGSNAHDGIAYAKSKGLTVLVTDHHLAKDAPPADAAVNPNGHGDNTYPFTQISGTAVIYKVLTAYARKYITDKTVLYHFHSLVLLVGVSTISDVMPMINENRYYVTQAVNMLTHFVEGHTPERISGYDDSPLGQYYRGVDLLVMTLNRYKKLNYGVDADTFGFIIGPMLNSPRRMTGDSKLAFDLFQTTRSMLLDDNASLPSDELYGMNEDRKILVRALTSSLFQHITACEDSSPVHHMVFNAVMGGGVAGLLSGKFTERFGLPSVAFSVPSSNYVPGTDPINVSVSGAELLVGSARSPESFDLHQFLTVIDTENPGLIAKWGGHPQAAGISIKPENYDRFCDIFINRYKQIMSEAFAEMEQDEHSKSEPVLPFGGEYIITTDAYDRLVSLHSAPTTCDVIRIDNHTPAMKNSVLSDSVRFFERLAPFGQGLAEPTFSVAIWMRDVRTFFMGADKQHVKLILPNGITVIDWNGAEPFQGTSPDTDNRVFIVTGKISINSYNGRESLQLIASDLVRVY